MLHVLKILAAVISGYMTLTLINMGTVLLMFPAPGFRETALASTTVMVLVEVAIIAVTSFIIGKGLLRLFKFQTRIPLYFTLGLVICVTGLNIYLGQSVEPLWYKLVYLVVLIPAAWYGNTIWPATGPQVIACPTHNSSKTAKNKQTHAINMEQQRALCSTHTNPNHYYFAEQSTRK